MSHTLTRVYDCVGHTARNDDDEEEKKRMERSQSNKKTPA